MEYKPTAIMLRQAYNVHGEARQEWIVEDHTDGSLVGRPMIFCSLHSALAWIKEATA